MGAAMGLAAAGVTPVTGGVGGQTRTCTRDGRDDGAVLMAASLFFWWGEGERRMRLTGGHGDMVCRARSRASAGWRLRWVGVVRCWGAWGVGWTIPFRRLVAHPCMYLYWLCFPFVLPVAALLGRFSFVAVPMPRSSFSFLSCLLSGPATGGCAGGNGHAGWRRRRRHRHPPPPHLSPSTTATGCPWPHPSPLPPAIGTWHQLVVVHVEDAPPVGAADARQPRSAA